MATTRKKATSKAKPRTAKRKTKKATTTRKRRSPLLEKALYRLRRFGLAFGIFVLTLWLCSWLILSGSVKQGGEWARQQFLTMTADWGLKVEYIKVEGREYSDSDILMALINVQKGDPLFALDPQEAQTLIKRIDWVRAVRVERRFPDTIYIALEERQPLALWQKDKRLHLLDEEGKVISTAHMERFKDLLIILGDDAPEHAPELIKFLQIEPSVYKRVTAASWVSNRRWNLELDKGQEVKLPEDDLGLALKSLADAQEEDHLLDKDVMSIDLREAGRIVVRPRAGAVQEYKASIKKGAKEGNI